MKQYTYYEFVTVAVTVNVPDHFDESDVDEIGSAYVDKLLYDDKTIRKRAADIDTPEVWYKGTDSTGDTEVHRNDTLETPPTK